MDSIPQNMQNETFVFRTLDYQSTAFDTLSAQLAEILSSPATTDYEIDLSSLAFEVGRKWGILQAFELVKKLRTPDPQAPTQPTPRSAK